MTDPDVVRIATQVLAGVERHRPYMGGRGHLRPRPAESGVYRTGPWGGSCYHAFLAERGWEGACRRDADTAVGDLRHWRALSEDLAAGVFTAPPGPQATHRRAA